MTRLLSIALIMFAGACAMEEAPEGDWDCESCDGAAPTIGATERIPVATCKLVDIDDDQAAQPGIQCGRAYMSDGRRPVTDAWFGAQATPFEFGWANTQLGKTDPLSEAWEPDSDIQLFFEYTVKSILPSNVPRRIVEAKEVMTVTPEELREGVTLYSKYSYIPVSFASIDVVNAHVDFGYSRNVYLEDWSSSETKVEPYLETLDLSLSYGRVATRILYDGVNDPVIQAVTFSNAIDQEVGGSKIPLVITGPMSLIADRSSGLRPEVDSDRQF